MCISRKKNTYQDDVVVSRTNQKPVNLKMEDPPIARPANQKPDKVEKLEKHEKPEPSPNMPVATPVLAATPNGEKEQHEPAAEPQKEEENQKSIKLKSRRKKEDDTLSNIPEDMPELEINRDKPEPFFGNEDLI